MRKLFLFVCLSILMFISNSAMATPYVGADITLNGSDYSAIGNVDNQWYVDGDSIWTAWDRNWVEYTVDLTAGNWNIGVNAINHGNLGTNWYSQFQITGSNLLSDTFHIPASDTEANYGYVNLDINNAGTYTVRYTWANDQYSPPLDANIQINSAFFDDTNTAPVPEPATMLLLGSGIVGLAGFRRKFKK